MKDIAIYCAGGFGREVACLLDIINKQSNEPQWNLVGFFDDTHSQCEQVSHFGTVLGGSETAKMWAKPLNVVIANGSPNAVKAIYGKIKENKNLSFPNIIHPNFNIVDKASFHIGKGNIIQANCSVSCNVTFGDFNVFNGSVVFGHDDNVGNYNTFMPAIRVSGAVTIGDGNFFGVGSIILQGLTVGNKVRIAAGSVLMTKPKDGNLYMGVPAKKVRF